MKYAICCSDCDGNDTYIYLFEGKSFFFDDFEIAESFLKEHPEIFTKHCFVTIVELVIQ